MTKFYLRTQSDIPFNFVSNPSFQASYMTSLFDCRYLDWCYIMTPGYTSLGTFTSQPLGNPEVPTKFKITETSTLFGYLTGKLPVTTGNPGRTSTFIGDPDRTILMYTGGVFSGVTYISSVWTTAGYSNPATEKETFLTELCTQIKDAKNLGLDSGYEEWNVIYGSGNFSSTNFYPVLYYPGNDPNADEIIEV
jgi:hypothetical protein